MRKISLLTLIIFSVFGCDESDSSVELQQSQTPGDHVRQDQLGFRPGIQDHYFHGVPFDETHYSSQYHCTAQIEGVGFAPEDSCRDGWVRLDERSFAFGSGSCKTCVNLNSVSCNAMWVETCDPITDMSFDFINFEPKKTAVCGDNNNTGSFFKAIKYKYKKMDNCQSQISESKTMRSYGFIDMVAVRGQEECPTTYRGVPNNIYKRIETPLGKSAESDIYLCVLPFEMASYKTYRFISDFYIDVFNPDRDFIMRTIGGDWRDVSYTNHRRVDFGTGVDGDDQINLYVKYNEGLYAIHAAGVGFMSSIDDYSGVLSGWSRNSISLGYTEDDRSVFLTYYMRELIPGS